MDRLFLDANVLFSAAYRADNGILRLWRLRAIEIMTSRYACEEARRNLPESEQRDRLESLLEGVRIIEHSGHPPIESEQQLPEKDRPILRAAVHSAATHLITGDITHFGRFFGTAVEGIRVLTPGAYLSQR